VAGQQGSICWQAETSGKRLLMVGDGLNEALATLMAADVSRGRECRIKGRFMTDHSRVRVSDSKVVDAPWQVNHKNSIRQSMEEQPISPTEKQPPSAIEAIVKLYVRLGNILALSEQKLHRVRLMSLHNDSNDFSFRLLREDCQNDIATIDAGIRELLKREPTRGYVDVCSPERVAGWAQYIRYPELPVTLEVYLDQKLLAQVVADRYGRDLEEANLGSGQHGFEFILPKELFLSAEIVEVKAPNSTAINGCRT
jgi:hypothetical protein